MVGDEDEEEGKVKKTMNGIKGKKKDQLTLSSIALATIPLVFWSKCMEEIVFRVIGKEWRHSNRCILDVVVES